MRRSALTCLICAGSVLATLPSAEVRAQEVSARDRQSAAEAYDRGTAAYLADDFAEAARWFETADRLAPAAAALVQAVRAHQRAGNAQRAATLALRLQALYPDDRTARTTAQRALADARQFLRVDVTCDQDCTVVVAGAIMGHTSFFLDAGDDHDVTAEFETGPVTQTATGGAGETVALSFEAPPAPPPVVEPDPVPVEPDPIVEAPAEGGGGVPLAVSITALVITAGLGGVLIWSGVDTLDGVPAYEANPTAEGLADGRSREERTNWLIAGTAVAGAATAILLIFTDWGGGDGDGNEADTQVEASLDLGADHAILGARGRF
ncbi:MAG: hypothetical protein H6719_36655 [Sandaracinaceae bacterium]|nr:hypothetical protein [Sandaracinaceae bacterium]